VRLYDTSYSRRPSTPSRMAPRQSVRPSRPLSSRLGRTGRLAQLLRWSYDFSLGFFLDWLMDFVRSGRGAVFYFVVRFLLLAHGACCELRGVLSGAGDDGNFMTYLTCFFNFLSTLVV